MRGAYPAGRTTHVLVDEHNRHILSVGEVFKRVLNGTSRGFWCSHGRKKRRESRHGAALTLIDNEEVALPSQVHISHAGKQETRDGVLG